MQSAILVSHSQP